MAVCAIRMFVRPLVPWPCRHALAGDPVEHLQHRVTGRVGALVGEEAEVEVAEVAPHVGVADSAAGEHLVEHGQREVVDLGPVDDRVEVVPLVAGRELGQVGRAVHHDAVPAADLGEQVHLGVRDAARPAAGASALASHAAQSPGVRFALPMPVKARAIRSKLGLGSLGLALPRSMITRTPTPRRWAAIRSRTVSSLRMFQDAMAILRAAGRVADRPADLVEVDPPRRPVAQRVVDRDALGDHEGPRLGLGRHHRLGRGGRRGVGGQRGPGEDERALTRGPRVWCAVRAWVYLQ